VESSSKTTADLGDGETKCYNIAAAET